MTRTRRPSEAGDAILRWWRTKDEDAAARALWGWIDRLKQRQRAENLLDAIHEAIYEGRPLGSGAEYPSLQHLRAQRSAPANLNITRSMVDTATARLSKRRPMPVIGADDAGWSEKLFAKRASRVLRRKLGSSKVERLKPTVIRDALIRGSGVAKVIRNGGDVDVERVPRHELVVDPREARYGEPRTMAQVKPIPRDVLIDAFPDFEDEIIKAARWARDEWNADGDDTASDDAEQIEVAEAWHLPSGANTKDGCHVICIRGTTLLREAWERPRFPFAIMHWSAPTRGMWGHGLVEDLTGIQAKVNDIARDIQEALYYGAMLKIFQARSSKVNKNALRARHPVVIEYDGKPPEYVAPNPVSQQQIQFLEWLIAKAYEISGISQMSASSKNPLGSNASGKALDTMYDIESDRFAQVEIGYAMFTCDLGQLIVDEARAIASDKEIKQNERAKWIREVKWSKVEIDAGEYHLGIEPVNFLPDSRAGKLSFVQELAKAGMIMDPTMTAALFDEPDIVRANRVLLGPYHALERIMEGLADVDVPMFELQPDPHMNLGLGIAMAKGEYNEALATQGTGAGAPEEVLERYRGWIDLAKGLKKKADDASNQNASQMPGAASLAGMPIGPGMPAMPNANMPPGAPAGMAPPAQGAMAA